MSRLRSAFEREASARSFIHLVPPGVVAAVALFYAVGLRVAVPGCIAMIMASLAALHAADKASPRARMVLRPLLALACTLAFGQLLCHVELARTQTTILSGSATVHVTGRVAMREADENGKMRYVVAVSATERPVLSRPPRQVRIAVSSRHEPIPIGGIYSGLVRLGPPSGPAWPDGYDFAFGAYFDGVGAYGFSLGAPEPVLDETPSATSERFAEWLVGLRVAMSGRIRAVLPGAEGAVAAALISGERTGIPEDIDEIFRVTGLSHVLSISGFHMVLVAGFVMGAVRSLLVLLPAHLLPISTRKAGAVAALMATTAYMAIAGPNVATERSYIMIAIMLVAVLVERPALTLRNVTLAAMAVLAIAPHAALTASFQMSFAATAALVGLAAALTRRWQTPPGEGQGLRPVAWLAVACIASAVAGAATAPYGLYHFQRLAPYGILANVATMPLFSFWVMPAALAAALAMPLGLDAPFLHLMGWGLSAVFAVTRYLAQSFPDQGGMALPTSSLIALSLALFLACFLASALRWLALPAAALGGLLAAGPARAPDILIYEDGKKVALIDTEGVAYLGKRPGRFISDQWERRFGPPRADSPLPCAPPACQLASASGIRLAWTDSIEETDRLCAEADLVIVARALVRNRCPIGGATLVTLRSLRRTGSLAISRGEGGQLVLTPSIPDDPPEWNMHRLAPWPEYWKKDGETRTRRAADETVSNAVSGPPAAPAPVPDPH
ncbi:ComEC/Rec2 family competence protein [Aureimonas altamirensis]|uniref:ComEC/Rec2 family competence protein n=1 Tax=Aureimonas altamirensis TaxID=370622 RepID=UPI0020367F05|nr:ComEC/Rec2 family competence protein [Aureimonas altamirensis]MCM2502871.1 ComEC/Rec2 family competence protein [Aureimonas altamirensis]